MNHLNVLVIDNQAVYRNAKVKILSVFKSINQCDSVQNGIEAMYKFETMMYDIVFVEIDIPIIDGMKITKTIKDKYPKIKIIILTMFNVKKQVIELLEMGVNGYILKSTDEEEIIKALIIISEGRQYFTDSVYKVWADHCINKSTLWNTVNKQPKLGTREIEIIMLICEQHTAKEIADILCVSDSTVNNHRSNIMQKIGVNNSVGIVLYAIEHGIFVI